MELLTIEQAIIMTNVAITVYLVSIIYQGVRYSKMMKPSAVHHLYSHGYMATFTLVGINMFYYKGWIMPLIFTALYTLSHLIKENYRLVHDGYWTQGIKDI